MWTCEPMYFKALTIQSYVKDPDGGVLKYVTSSSLTYHVQTFFDLAIIMHFISRINVNISEQAFECYTETPYRYKHELV